MAWLPHKNTYQVGTRLHPCQVHCVMSEAVTRVLGSLPTHQYNEYTISTVLSNIVQRKQGVSSIATTLSTSFTTHQELRSTEYAIHVHMPLASLPVIPSFPSILHRPFTPHTATSSPAGTAATQAATSPQDTTPPRNKPSVSDNWHGSSPDWSEHNSSHTRAAYTPLSSSSPDSIPHPTEEAYSKYMAWIVRRIGNLTHGISA